MFLIRLTNPLSGPPDNGFFSLIKGNTIMEEQALIYDTTLRDGTQGDADDYPTTVRRIEPTPKR